MKNPSSPCTDLTPNQINALIHLLSDQDPKIAQTIHNRLVAAGQSAVSFLQQAKEAPTTSLLAERIAAVLVDIKLQQVEQTFKRLVTTQSPDSMDLEMGAFLIAQAGDPDLHIPPYHQQIEDMAEVLTQRWNPTLPTRQGIQVINQLLFQELGFKGNTKNYYDPDNSFLHKVLERRVGIPISLSVLYLLLSQRLRLPIVGIGLPGHFMVKIETEPVFIDCFNQGIVLTQQDVARFLREYGAAFDPQYLNPTSTPHILARMLRNLVAIYQKRNEPKLTERFLRLLAFLDPIDEAAEPA